MCDPLSLSSLTPFGSGSDSNDYSLNRFDARAFPELPEPPSPFLAVPVDIPAQNRPGRNTNVRKRERKEAAERAFNLAPVNVNGLLLTSETLTLSQQEAAHRHNMAVSTFSALWKSIAMNQFGEAIRWPNRAKKAR